MKCGIGFNGNENYFLAGNVTAEFIYQGEIMAVNKRKKRLKKGIIQVYTGGGKGKTTAAVGLAARAAGRGFRVKIFRFLKKGRFGSGEDKALNKIKNISVVVFNQPAPFFDRRVTMQSLGKRIKEDFEKAAEIIGSGRYDVVILDEFTHAAGVVGIKKILNTLKNRPQGVEIIITGRNAPAALRKEAALVTEMKEIKHPYKKGLRARKGVEY